MALTDKYDRAARARPCRSCKAAADEQCHNTYLKQQYLDDWHHPSRREDAIVEALGFKPGVYCLTKQVPNHKPDRREKYDWRKFPTWSRGMVIYAVSGECGIELEGPFNANHAFLLGTAPTDLVDALECKVVLFVHEALRAAGLNEDNAAIRALQHLVNDGALTIDQVVIAAASRSADSEQED